MRQLFIVGDTPDNLKDFFEKHKGEFKIEQRFNTCSSSVKIRYVGHIDDDSLVFEFATDEDKRFYRQAGDIGQDVEFVVVE